ncbi:hypothetical protein B0E33_18660 [Roseibium algicola]|uniref:2-iminobutanoate/2-iminopropanoate deaminase n=1 Tax=Roseibium algicola TaxID=2857014 RepID=A0ABM6I4T3_9HYPH|nr:RidA family protein [Roseibium aggregatum]AQQ05349.1 hypothetical protein B0E33_18660 [Roseibium aggregatum]
MDAIEPEGISRGGAYSTAVVAGDFLFVAGQTPRDANRKIIGKTIEEQTAATMDNLGAILSATGASFDDVVKATVHLKNLDDAPQFNAVYSRYFPGAKPVRTTVGSQLNGVLVEIDVIAFVGRQNNQAEVGR